MHSANGIGRSYDLTAGNVFGYGNPICMSNGSFYGFDDTAAADLPNFYFGAAVNAPPQADADSFEQDQHTGSANSSCHGGSIGSINQLTPNLRSTLAPHCHPGFYSAAAIDQVQSVDASNLSHARTATVGSALYHGSDHFFNGCHLDEDYGSTNHLAQSRTEAATDIPGAVTLESSPAADTAAPDASSAIGNTATSTEPRHRKETNAQAPATISKAQPRLPRIPTSNTCGICGTTVSRKADLRRHMLKHDKVAAEAFKCPMAVCVSTPGFYRRDKLHSHLEASHGLMPVGERWKGRGRGRDRGVEGGG